MRLTPTAHVAKGALMIYLRPRLAQDAAIDLNPILADLNRKNFAGKRGIIAAAIQTQYKNKLAKDADLDDVADVLEALQPLLEKEGEQEDEMSTMPNAGVPPLDEDGELPAFLQSKMSPEDCARAMDMIRGHADDEETEEEREEREKAEDRAYEEDRARRAEDARRHMGRDETEEEKKEREEGEDRARDARRAEDRRRADDRKRRADDRRRADDKRRADDRARRAKDGETPEQCREREEGEDRKRAEDRKRRADDRRKRADDRARDWARDVMDRHADDRKRADDAKRAEDAKKGMDKKAMDEAIKTQVDAAVIKERQNQRAILEAVEFVRPWTGTLSNLGFDSAEKVYGRALEMANVDIKDVPPAAFRKMLGLVPLPGSVSTGHRLAHDAAPPNGVRPASERFGGGHIRVMG